MHQSGGLIIHSNAEVKRVKSIQFGLLSPEAIQNMAVCEITNPRSFEENGTPSVGGINDLRMGTTDKKLRCATCRCNYIDCPGHFGYISLFKPVFHVGYIKECVQVLQLVCKYCSRLLNQDPRARIKQCPYCNRQNYNYKKVGLKIHEITYVNNNRNEVEIKPEQVYAIFQRITNEDCVSLSFNPRITRPECMIIKNLAVCPLSVRPPVSVDSSLTSQDDLTHQYCQIIQDNDDLRRHFNNGAPVEVINSDFVNLQMNVAALINNNLSYTKVHKNGSGDPIVSLISRINGKEGGIRGNLMGKRVDYCARTVISPDPNLAVDEIGIPKSIAENLTIPEAVNEKNKDFLQRLVLNGTDRYPGAKQVKTRNGKFNLKFAKKIKLEIGDIVERNVLDGDYIIFNRQPSLHKMSMMGHRVKIFINNLTFRLNLSVTSPYNADFDGDEMNLHLPQSLETKAEIMNIMHVPKQVVSPQSNRPVMGIVQDSLLGCKLFTSRDTFLTYEQILNIVINIDDFDEQELKTFISLTNEFNNNLFRNIKGKQKIIISDVSYEVNLLFNYANNRLKHFESIAKDDRDFCLEYMIFEDKNSSNSFAKKINEYDFALSEYKKVLELSQEYSCGCDCP